METTTNSCCCHQELPPDLKQPLVNRMKPVKTLPSVLLSVLVAFFPKCPMCWAVYMSMLGSLGLSGLGYPPWLLPLLLVLMLLHLLLLFKKARKEGYRPFLLSLTGTALLLSARFIFPAEQWLLYLALAFIVTASLLHGFSGTRLKTLRSS